MSMHEPGKDQTHGKPDPWPSLPLDAWQETYTTLQMWTQIVGKVRMELSPPVNHWWHCALYVTSRGLTTSPIPCGDRTFQIDFDFLDHRLLVETSDGGRRALALAPRPVAVFYQKLMTTLRDLEVEVAITPIPNEVPDPIPFPEDYEHAAYDADYVNRFWRVLVQTDRVFKEFRGRFLGKCSPVNFYWGSFDLAVTRFSGRRAPEHPGGIPNLPDFVTREAYSHEVISCGFWPGSGPVQAPAFYCYAVPAPPTLKQEQARPASAFFSPELGEFVLMYEDVRNADSPDATLMQFLQSTYEAGAKLLHWDRAALEREASDPKNT